MPDGQSLNTMLNAYGLSGISSGGGKDSSFFLKGFSGFIFFKKYFK